MKQGNNDFQKAAGDSAAFNFWIPMYLMLLCASWITDRILYRAGRR